MSNKRRLSKITILPTLIGTLGVFYSLLSVISSVSPVASTVSATSSLDSTVSVTLENLIALRILNKTASSTITGIDIEITPTPNGVFSKESMLVEVSTRNATGYELYMTSGGIDIEGSYTTNLVHTDSTIAADTSDMGIIPTLDSNTTITEAEYRISNSNYKNTWGYSLNGLTITRTEDDDTNLTGSNNANTSDNVSNGITNTIVENTDTSAITYTNIPAHTTNIKINEKDSPIEQDLTPVTIGVNATASKPAGTYTNILEYTAVGKALEIDYDLKFDSNTSTIGGGSAIDTPDGLSDTSTASHLVFNIPTSYPKIDYYGFVGWSESSTERIGSGSGPDGLYIVGDTFDFVIDDADPESDHKTLYAIWEPLEFFTITYMQDMTTNYCAEITTPSAEIKGLTDATEIANHTDTTGIHHGDNAYVAQRVLYDYRGIDGTGTAAKPASGSNAVSYTVRKLADGNCWMTENLKLTLVQGRTYEVGTFSGGTYNWIITASEVDTTSKNPLNKAITQNTKANTNGGNWYYPWYAATAGQGTGALSPTINRSICPKGWRLPKGDMDDKSYYNLITNIYSLVLHEVVQKTIMAFPLGYIATGHYHSGGIDHTTDGFYQSSNTVSDDSSRNRLMQFNPTYIYSQSTIPKERGVPVRCVAI